MGDRGEMFPSLKEDLQKWSEKGDLQPAQKDDEILHDFMKIMFYRPGYNISQFWEMSNPDDFKNAEVFKHEKNEPCRSYKKVKTKNVQSSRTTKVPSSRS